VKTNFEKGESEIALLRLGNLKCQAVLVGSQNSTHTIQGCLVSSVWGNQQFCMQR